MARIDDLRRLIDDAGSACILWPYARRSHGYGIIQFQGRPQNAHRVALTLVTGEPEEGMEAAHGPCHNRLCVNPNHLSWKTRSGNSRDRLRDGTRKPSKLTPEDVQSIQQSTGRAIDLAPRYGISKSHFNVVRRRGKPATAPAV